MNKQQIVKELKSNYPRDIRKQLIKTIMHNEKNNDKAIDQQYHLLDQIFSYVLKVSDWSIADNLEGWNQSPLRIMTEVFPQLESTQWYREKTLSASGNIDIIMEDDAKQ